jgi:hypothetical protein
MYVWMYTEIPMYDDEWKRHYLLLVPALLKSLVASVCCHKLSEYSQ